MGDGVNGEGGKAIAPGDSGDIGDSEETKVSRLLEAYTLDGIRGTGGNGRSPYMSIIASMVVDFGFRILVTVLSIPFKAEE